MATIHRPLCIREQKKTDRQDNRKLKQLRSIVVHRHKGINMPRIPHTSNINTKIFSPLSLRYRSAPIPFYSSPFLSFIPYPSIPPPHIHTSHSQPCFAWPHPRPPLHRYILLVFLLYINSNSSNIKQPNTINAVFMTSLLSYRAFPNLTRTPVD